MGLFEYDRDEINIMLEEEDFKCLVRGGVIKINDHIKIALSDIGFHSMHESLDLAESGHEIGKNRDRQTNDGRGWK